MFRIIQPNTHYVDAHGSLCKILRTKDSKVHYLRNGHVCIASMQRFQTDFEFTDRREVEQIWADIERAEHIKHLRAMRVA